MGVIGLGGIDALKRKIEQLPKEVLPRVSRQFAAEALEQTLSCFDGETSPYGDAWPPMARSRSRGGGALLQDTGRLKNSIGIRAVNASGFELSTSVVYAAVHNFGHQFAAREQLAIRIAGGMLMFVKEGQVWSETMGKKKWKKVVKTILGKKRIGSKELSGYDEVGKVGKTFMVTVAPKIPKRQYLPDTRIPPGWMEPFQGILDKAVTAHVG
jgi:phage gpG-like protein